MQLKSFGKRRWLAVALPAALAVAAALPQTGHARRAMQPPAPDLPLPLVPLNTVPVPMPNLAGIVKDQAAAIRLGKALFWDMQIGSDGTACASCHYQAGADGRDRHQMSKAFDKLFDTAHVFNYQLKLTDFPFTQFLNILDSTTTRTRNSNDVVGSQGVLKFAFQGLAIDAFGNIGAFDRGSLVADTVHRVGTVNVRQVTGRNSPSVINAIYNQRNFWDGRAHNEFNGVNPFGDSDVNARVYRTTAAGTSEPIQLRIKDASLASQAVGPVNNDVEMAFAGRNFPQVGKKMLGRRPLALQKVALDDSVLGSIATATTGLSTNYRDMVKAAFDDWWWNSTDKFTVNTLGRVVPSPTGEYDQMQANFSLFFGIAVLAYEATLVSDNTPYDRFLAGDTTAISPAAANGFTLFQTERCNLCHAGGPLTNAATPVIALDAAALGVLVPAEVMQMADGLPSGYDIGFYNVAVRLTAEDLGLGGVDPFGKPLSLTRSLQQGLIVDPLRPLDQQILPGRRTAVNGAFKTPGLRNVALTAPYFHNGGAATLGQAIEHYQRAGNFPWQNLPNVSNEIFPTTRLTSAQKNDLLQFLLSMTDARVEYRSAPFDHPELVIPNGHETVGTAIRTSGGIAVDSTITIPATGRNGGVPLRRFLGNIETKY